MKKYYTIIVQQFDENNNPLGEVVKGIVQDDDTFTVKGKCEFELVDHDASFTQQSEFLTECEGALIAMGEDSKLCFAAIQENGLSVDVNQDSVIH